MNRIHSIVLIVAFVVVACSSDDSPGDEPERSESVLDALVRSVKFVNGELRQGDIATLSPSLDGVVLLEHDAELDVSGGTSSLIGFEIEGLEDSDELAATLLQFEDAEQHVRVPIEDASSRDVEVSFTVDEDVCDDLCPPSTARGWRSPSSSGTARSPRSVR